MAFILGWLFLAVREPLFASVAGRPLFIGLAAVLSVVAFIWQGPRLRVVWLGAVITALGTRAAGFLVADRPWRDRTTGAVVYVAIAFAVTVAEFALVTLEAERAPRLPG